MSATPQAPRAAWRLTFAYSGDTPRYVGALRVAMTLPPSHPTGDYRARGAAGFWFELHDSAGKTLYGRRLHFPLRAHHEAASPRGGVEAVPIADPRGTFEILVPALPQPTTVILFGHAAELLRVELAGDRP